jgi:hypothetical protein
MRLCSGTVVTISAAYFKTRVLRSISERDRRSLPRRVECDDVNTIASRLYSRRDGFRRPKYQSISPLPRFQSAGLSAGSAKPVSEQQIRGQPPLLVTSHVTSVFLPARKSRAVYRLVPSHSGFVNRRLSVQVRFAAFKSPFKSAAATQSHIGAVRCCSLSSISA